MWRIMRSAIMDFHQAAEYSGHAREKYGQIGQIMVDIGDQHVDMVKAPDSEQGPQLMWVIVEGEAAILGREPGKPTYPQMEKQLVKSQAIEIMLIEVTKISSTVAGGLVHLH